MAAAVDIHQSCNSEQVSHQQIHKKKAFEVPMQKPLKDILVKNEITRLSECSPHIMFIKYFHFKCPINPSLNPFRSTSTYRETYT